MECNGIYYTVKESKWNIVVPTFDLVRAFNKLVNFLSSNEQVNITVFSLVEPIKERSGTVYRNVSEIHTISYESGLVDIRFTHKNGTFSFREVFGDVPIEFFFYDLDTLETFSDMDTSSEYTSIDLMFIADDFIRRINITKEVT